MYAYTNASARAWFTNTFEVGCTYNFSKRAIHFLKRALYSFKRALFPLKRTYDACAISSNTSYRALLMEYRPLQRDHTLIWGRTALFGGNIGPYIPPRELHFSLNRTYDAFAVSSNTSYNALFRPRMDWSHSKRHELVDCPLFTIARQSIELYCDYWVRIF